MDILLQTEHYLEFLSLKGGCTGSSEFVHVKMQNWWKSHVAAQISFIQGWQAWKDDTAANNMKIRCRGFDDESLLYENIEPNRNEWGTYGIWSDNCGPNSAVCGIQTKIEQPQGNGDDTALNDLALYCC